MNTLATNHKVTCKRVRANPHFETWMLMIYKQARAKNSPYQGMIKEALESLMKYPLPLRSGAECIILKGFNKRLCKYLDDLLQKNNNYYANAGTGFDNSALDSSSQSGENHHRDLQSASNDAASDGYPIIDLTASEMPGLLPKPSADIIQHINVDNNQDTNTISPGGSKNTINRNNTKKKPKYKPTHQSGAYAILVALLEHQLENPDKPMLTKQELIEKAQKHSEESFVRPKPNSYYTAWSNMTTLEKKGLVKKNKTKKAEFILTEEGQELAKEILRDANTIPTINDLIFNDLPSTSSAVVKQNGVFEPPYVEIPSTSANKNVIEMAPGTFDIILLIDKNETGGLKKKNDPTVAQFNKFKDLKHEYRSLKVGDFTWIAKHKVNQQELVLPFIIERKRMDDLGASIKDGRFHEQKFRLRKCGIDNVIYLVENYGKNKHVGLPLQTLMQALANTRVQDGFKVHMTDSLTSSVRFLAMMTKRLTIRFQKNHLRGCADDARGDMLMTFDYFNKLSAKTKPLTVTEAFIKLLLQLRGMSVDKALAITKKYPSPRSLIQAYMKCDRKEGETLLAHLKCMNSNRNVGPATSKTIYHLFSSNGSAE